MKRVLFLFASLLMFTCAFAAVNVNDVVMVSYEQKGYDRTGALALKNNTQEEIQNVAFRITYYDMQDNAIDYKDFEESVNIEPGMTKRLKIPSYERERFYHYYKTEGNYGNPEFKIKFELKNYNDPNFDVSESNSDDDFDEYVDSDSTGSSILAGTLGVVLFFVFIGSWIGLYVLVAIMAKKYHRNVVLWVILSILASPLLIAIILLVVGKDKSAELDDSWNNDKP